MCANVKRCVLNLDMNTVLQAALQYCRGSEFKRQTVNNETVFGEFISAVWLEQQRSARRPSVVGLQVEAELG